MIRENISLLLNLYSNPKLITMENLSSTKVNLKEEKIALSEMLEKLVDAEKRRDTESAVSFFMDDAIVQEADIPQITGSNAIKNLYNEFFKLPFTSFDSKSTKTVMASSGDMAYDIGWNLFIFPGPDGDIEIKGKYLLVLKKVKGEWKVASIAISNDQPAK